MKKISVLYVEPNKKPVAVEIENTLESFQKMVGGYIEMLCPFDDEVAIICNEDGKFNGSQLNRGLRDESGKLYDIIAGSFLVVSAPYDRDNFESLSDKYRQKYARRFEMPEMFVKHGDNIFVVPVM